MLFVVPATLNSVLPDKYFVHAFLLIKSLRILLANDITEESLQLTEKLLTKFCKLMEDYYGEVTTR